jgi:hypothetical protein
MRYKVFDPESKVIGQAMLGFKAAADQDLIEPLLEKAGLVDIQPDQWYPLQSWLNVLSDISEQAGEYASMLTFVNIGQKVAASIKSPEVDGFVAEKGFIEFMISDINQQQYSLYQHRGSVGSTIYEKMNEAHLKCNINSPYPPDFWYGIIYGLAKRYLRSSFIVHYEDIAMRTYDTSQTIVIHMITE